MNISVKTIQSTDTRVWDNYVSNHPDATLYHLSGWKNVIEKTYGHKTYYLMAVQEGSSFRRRRIEVSQFHPRLPSPGTGGQEGTEKKSVKSC